jgi:hypothetical protein
VALAEPVASYARSRADELAANHARVLSAGSGVPRVSIDPVLTSDVIGLYVLLPANF